MYPHLLTSFFFCAPLTCYFEDFLHVLVYGVLAFLFSCFGPLELSRDIWTLDHGETPDAIETRLFLRWN
jgi:hypothetical protein